MNQYRLHYSIILFAALFVLLGCTSDKAKTENYLSEAQSFFDEAEYQKAIIQIKNAIQLDNSSAKAYTLLVKTHLKLGDAQEAFKALLRLEQLEPENLEHKLQLASFYLLGKQRPEAERKVKEVLDKEPENIQALYLTAGILGDKKENLDQIRDVYLKILKLDPKQAKAHFALARLFAAQKELEETQNHLKQAIAIEPENIEYTKGLLSLYMAKRQYDDAEALMHSLIAKKPADAEPLILLSNFYISRNNPQKAESTFLKAIEKDPKNLNSYMLLAKLLNAEKKPAEAEKYILKALDQEPDNIAVKNAYADFQFANKEIEKAETLVDEILSKRPDHLQSKMLKGKLLAAKKEFDKAIVIFQELLSEEPESFLFNFLLGSAYFEKNEFNEAAPYLAKVLEKNPNFFQARLMMADLYFRKGDLYLAEDNVKKVLKTVPKHYNANILLGNIEMANNKMDLARAIFEDMVEQEPENPTAYFRLGLVNRLQKNNSEALKNFNAALALNPSLMDVFSNLISVYASEKQYQTGLKLCDEYLEKRKDSPIIRSIVLNLKGNLLLATQQIDPGKQALLKSIESNPAYITPYLTLASINTSQNKIEDAINLYTALIEKRPDQASPHSLVGTLYEKQKKIDLAEDHYKKALAIDPDYIPALNNLAFLYAEQDKELNKALDLARQAKERMGKLPAIMDTLGWVYYKKQLYENALEEFEACTEKEPKNPIFQYHLGLAHNKLGNYEKAEKALKKSLELQKDFQGSDEAQKVLDQL